MEYDAAMITEHARIIRLSLYVGKPNILRFRPNTVEKSFDTEYLGVNLQRNLS